MFRLLQATGEFEVTGGGKPDDLAAIQVNPASPDWILAKVISHDSSVGMYTLSDEDTESNKSTFLCAYLVWCMFLAFFLNTTDSSLLLSFSLSSSRISSGGIGEC